MLFFMLLNFSISIVGALSIYPLPVGPSDSTNTENYEHGGIIDYNVSKANSQDMTFETSLQSYFAGPILSGILGGVIFASIASYILKVPVVAAVSYGLFAGVFWAFFTSAFDIFFKISYAWSLDSTTNMGVQTVIWIFGIIVIITFIAGFMQMLSGGWKAIE
jgi:hypothetical protein